ncbi:hypothetical protein EYR36_008166 [Pleurotus pulmonarius]|nr:hypothetical protein EYR36_008166 [Pleurotus pulmonarius]
MLMSRFGWLTLLVLAVSVVSILADPPYDYYVHEKRTDLPSPRISARRPPLGLAFPLRIGLRQRNLEDLPGHLLAVSDPTSPTYGRHWSPERVVEAFSPSSHSVASVKRWLIDSGIEESRIRMRTNKAWLDVQNATVREVEKLLRTEYQVLKRENGEETIGCHSYQLPVDVGEHVDFIIPTVQHSLTVSAAPPERHTDIRYKSNIRREPQGSADFSRCHEAMTPDRLRALYNITYKPKTPAANNSFAVVNFHPNTYLQSDLDLFFENFSPSLVGSSPTFVSIDGGTLNATTETGVGEAGWILQYAMSLAAPQKVTFLKVGDQTFSGPFGAVSFNEWLDDVDGSYCTSDGGDDLNFDPQFPDPIPIPGAFNDHSCGIIRPPNVISVSRGDEEGRLTEFYSRRQCNEYAKLGLMGVTVIYGSGNTGTAGTTRGYCMDENGTVSPNGTLFNPAWPGSCPWITSVGGTQLRANATVFDQNPEEVTSMDLTMGFFTSAGGGFSRRFPTPAYQNRAVQGYLKQLKRTDPGKFKVFNSHGRGYPDLSVISNRYISAENGALVNSSGVSGSSPVMGAMISLINDARLSNGKGSVGFINPALYSSGFASAFRDIVVGTNTGCKGLQGEQFGGFAALPGWDAASGLGTPNFDTLLKKWIELP